MYKWSFGLTTPADVGSFDHSPCGGEITRSDANGSGFACASCIRPPYHDRCATSGATSFETNTVLSVSLHTGDCFADYKRALGPSCSEAAFISHHDLNGEGFEAARRSTKVANNTDTDGGCLLAYEDGFLQTTAADATCESSTSAVPLVEMNGAPPTCTTPSPTPTTPTPTPSSNLDRCPTTVTCTSFEANTVQSYCGCCEGCRWIFGPKDAAPAEDRHGTSPSFSEITLYDANSR